MEPTVQSHIEALSDTRLYREAERFFERLQPMTAAQMSGLWGVCTSVASVDEMKKFVGHQGDKAKNKGRLGEQTFWLELRKQLDGLVTQAKSLAPTSSRDEEREVAYRVVREFVQHLVAHNRYLLGGGQGRARASD